MMDLHRELSLNIVRVTEVAALRASRLLGRGDKNAADKAAVDGMRGMLDFINIRGTVVIGEGVKDRAPMLYIGEKVGNWDNDMCPEVDIAVDPIDGTRLVAYGQSNALAIMAIGDKGCIKYLPTYYVKKLAYGPRLNGYLDINNTIKENLHITAARLDKEVRDLTISVLDRPRHKSVIEEISACGSRIKLISDGDVAAAIATCMDDGKSDLYMGIGGAPEAVLTAAALRCLDGDIQVKLDPIDAEEAQKALDEGYDLNKVYFAKDLAQGDDIVFTCTGITDGELLPGVTFKGKKAVTRSLVTRLATKTLRRIETEHNLKAKTIPSKEFNMEHTL